MLRINVREYFMNGKQHENAYLLTHTSIDNIKACVPSEMPDFVMHLFLVEMVKIITTSKHLRVSNFEY